MMDIAKQFIKSASPEKDYIQPEHVEILVNELLSQPSLDKYHKHLIQLNAHVSQEQRYALWSKLDWENDNDMSLCYLFPLPYRLFIEHPQRIFCKSSLSNLNLAWKMWSDEQRRELPDTLATAYMIRSVINSILFPEAFPIKNWQSKTLQKALLEYTLQECLEQEAYTNVTLDDTEQGVENYTHVLMQYYVEKTLLMMQCIYPIDVKTTTFTNIKELAILQYAYLYTCSEKTAQEWIQNHLHIRKYICQDLTIYSIDQRSEHLSELSW